MCCLYNVRSNLPPEVRVNPLSISNSQNVQMSNKRANPPAFGSVTDGKAAPYIEMKDRAFKKYSELIYNSTNSAAAICTGAERA